MEADTPEARAAALPLVREIFAMFSTDAADSLSKHDYRRYLDLQGIGGLDASGVGDFPACTGEN